MTCGLMELDEALVEVDMVLVENAGQGLFSLIDLGLDSVSDRGVARVPLHSLLQRLRQNELSCKDKKYFKNS